MAAVSTIIAATAAAAALGSLAHGVESSNQARRLAGQERDRQNRDTEVAIGKQKEEERSKERIAIRDRQRINQRRDGVGGVGVFSGAGAPTGGSKVGAAGGEAGTLLGV